MIVAITSSIIHDYRRKAVWETRPFSRLYDMLWLGCVLSAIAAIVVMVIGHFMS
jgi:hypothetical protein